MKKMKLLKLTIRMENNKYLDINKINKNINM